MSGITKHIISSSVSAREALEKINAIREKRLQSLFVVDDAEKMIGSVTDGDIRRGLIKGLELTSPVNEFMNRNFRFLDENNRDPEKIQEFKDLDIALVPILTESGKLVDLINVFEAPAELPIDVVIMAGGEGRRLRPLTETVPKPLLEIGNKPILRHTLERLANQGIQHAVITVNYLGQQIKDYLKQQPVDGLKVSFVEEDRPLGTAGSLGLVDDVQNEFVLLMNSDLLTTINFNDFYRFFNDENADMAIAAIPYNVSVPYAVLETEGHKIIRLKEKPVYTYYSNAGIYLMKKEVLELIPKNERMDATDLVEKLIDQGSKVVTYHLLEYWLDIGRMEDYRKAQEDIKHLTLTI